MKAVNYFASLLSKIVLTIGRWLPMGPTFRLMRLLGGLAWRVSQKRRALMLYNLELALGGETTTEERERIGRESMINVFISVGECLHMYKIYDRWERHFQFEGKEWVRQLIDRKQGFFAFGGHFGGWMLPGAIMLPFPDLPGAAMVARPLRNPYMQELLEHMAKDFGGRLLTTRGTGQEIVAAAERGEMIGLYMDQESRRDQGIFVKFFGREASSHVVPGHLVWKHDIPLIPYWLVRLEPGRYRVTLGPPVEYELTDDPEENNRRVTQAMASEVERIIRLHPEQWLWAHNRWRRRPDGTKDTRFEKKKKRGRKQARRKGNYLSSVDQAKRAAERQEKK